MAQLIEDSLLQTIKNDDLKAFNALMEKAQCGTYRLGRFPVLSLLYLYKSRKILSAYEEKFFKITNFEKLREPVEVSKKFSAKAGKCLRLYFDEVVTPHEMLLILDKTGRLKKIFPLTKQPTAVKERLKQIYSIKYSLAVKFEGDNIIIDRRPLSYREKKNIATACLCSVLAVTLAVGVPVTTVTLIPKPVEGEVKKLSQINFSSQEEYTLIKDIVLPENYSVEKVNCTINGNGKKLIFGKGASLGELDGKISDLVIDSRGDAIFTSVTETASIKNVTVNVTADVTAAAGTAFVALTNYGTIDGVTVNVSGSINALAPTSQTTEEPEELSFGGLVLSNEYKSKNSIIKNCTVNFSGFSLVGESSANAAFGGVVGVNSSYVQECTVTGEISSDTFDIAGICSINEGVLSGNVNEAELSQTSSEIGWNPMTCGIVLSNRYAVEYCENRGSISSFSDCLQEENTPTVYSAGIAVYSYGYVNYSVNEGSVSAVGGGTAYAGGICARSYLQTFNCLSEGDLTVTANTVYAGGIYGVSEVYDFYNFGTAASCISECKITVNGNTSYVGGIVGCVQEKPFTNYDGSIIYSGGSVVNCYFTGACGSEVTCFGNIIGVCGENIYERNYYFSGFNAYFNFNGNFYAENGFTAFGAIISEDGSFSSAEDKDTATSAAVSEMQDFEEYKNILSKLER